MQFEVDLREYRLQLRDGHAVVHGVLGEAGLAFLDPFQTVQGFILRELIGEASDPAGEEESTSCSASRPAGRPVRRSPEHGSSGAGASL